ncbi:MAG: dNTP triphosphohydrolase [Spirochaetaceae bacterium]|nr:dNTP triphosphohydrolase [Spirochaetaceae bacterium]
MRSQQLQADQHIHDFLRFEGNAQSLRLVAKLQILADDTGLNLTFGTLSALRKYLPSSDPAEKICGSSAFKKPGYFASENDLIPLIQHETGTSGARHPICFLVEAADDIAYLPADIEDAVKKGVVSWNTIEEHLAAAEADSLATALKHQTGILKAGSSCVPNDLDDDIWASAFRTAAIRVMVNGACTVFQDRYEDIITGNYHGSLLDDSDAKDLAKSLRCIAREHVYPTRSTLQLELMGRHVIGDLMDVLWEGAQEMPSTGNPDPSRFAGKAAALVSSNYRKVFQAALAEGRLPEQYCRLQLVTDYICGMTDSFATNLHSELFNGR